MNIVKITEGSPDEHSNGLILFCIDVPIGEKMASQTIEEVAQSPQYGCEEVVFSFNILCNSFQLFIYQGRTQLKLVNPLSRRIRLVVPKAI